MVCYKNTCVAYNTGVNAILNVDLFDREHNVFGEVPAMVSTKLNDPIDVENGYTILLSHRPELFESYVGCSVNLVFSGHAHGGQFRLPLIGGLIAPNQGLLPEYDAGVFSDRNTHMVVSRDPGNSVIPLRFHNRPEIVLWSLMPMLTPLGKCNRRKKCTM